MWWCVDVFLSYIPFHASMFFFFFFFSRVLTRFCLLACLLRPPPLFFSFFSFSFSSFFGFLKGQTVFFLGLLHLHQFSGAESPLFGIFRALDLVYALDGGGGRGRDEEGWVVVLWV